MVYLKNVCHEYFSSIELLTSIVNLEKGCFKKFIEVNKGLNIKNNITKVLQMHCFVLNEIGIDPSL